MAVDFRNVDWTLIQAFLAVAEEGSLSAAARKLGQSQPTLGRHIKALEDAVGVPVVVRHARGFDLTDMGAELLPHARRMHGAMNDIRQTVAKHETEITGSVRVTSSHNMSHGVLPKILSEARQRYPGVQIDLIPNDESENLLFGDADIAVRLYRPTQLDLVTQYLGEIEIGIYASTAYLDRVGRPKTPMDVFKLDYVGFDKDTRLIDGMRDAGFEVDRSRFATRCDDTVTQWELVRQGCGVGFFLEPIGRTDPLVELLPLPVPNPTLPMWLTAGSAVRHIPRVDVIWEMLRDALPPFAQKGTANTRQS